QGEEFVASVFTRLPANSVIISYWDALQPMGYEHCVEGWRRDLLVLSPFDPDYRSCDGNPDLGLLVREHRAYALMYQPYDVQTLTDRYSLTQIAVMDVPYAGHEANFK